MNAQRVRKSVQQECTKQRIAGLTKKRLIEVFYDKPQDYFHFLLTTCDLDHSVQIQCQNQEINGVGWVGVHLFILIVIPISRLTLLVKLRLES